MVTTEKAASRISLYDLTPPELEGFFLSIGEKKFRAKQVLDFLYRHPTEDFNSMSTLSKELRGKLAKTARLNPLKLIKTVESTDGAIKHAYKLTRPNAPEIAIESVWMPSESTDTGPFGERLDSDGQET